MVQELHSAKLSYDLTTVGGGGRAIKVFIDYATHVYHIYDMARKQKTQPAFTELPLRTRKQRQIEVQTNLD